MTKPLLLPGGGKSVAVTANQAILTEYAPVTIINISTSRVWVADSSGVGPQNGVPVDPGTALPWKNPGQLWAVLDPAASGSATVILTSAVDDWTPSPATIASQVASALLAGGVPNVFTNTLLAFHALGSDLAPGAHFDLDIHAYASLNVQTISTGNVGITALKMAFYQESTAGNSTPVIEYLTNADSAVSAEWVVPINAGSVRITNMSTATMAVIIYGSNRAVPALANYGGNALPRFLGYTGAYTNGSNVALTATDGLQSSTALNRSVQLIASAPVAGAIELQYCSPTGAQKAFTIANVSANVVLTTTISHPIAVCTWSFVPFATLAGSNATALILTDLGT